MFGAPPWNQGPITKQRSQSHIIYRVLIKLALWLIMTISIGSMVKALESFTRQRLVPYTIQAIITKL